VEVSDGMTYRYLLGVVRLGCFVLYRWELSIKLPEYQFKVWDINESIIIQHSSCRYIYSTAAQLQVDGYIAAGQISVVRNRQQITSQQERSYWVLFHAEPLGVVVPGPETVQSTADMHI